MSTGNQNEVEVQTHVDGAVMEALDSDLNSLRVDLLEYKKREAVMKGEIEALKTKNKQEEATTREVRLELKQVTELMRAFEEDIHDKNHTIKRLTKTNLSLN